LHGLVWHLAGQGWTADAIAGELAKHRNGIGAKHADRLYEEVAPSYQTKSTTRLQDSGHE
jgi:hypothetical protein